MSVPPIAIASVRQITTERDSSSVLRPSSFISELRAFLQTRLPDYMIPAAFVLLDALPLTPHGKLDRQKLPAPDTKRPEIDTAFAAPRGAVETTLAAIWADVLRLEQVGVDDNFFALGGDSILSIQIIARARQAGIAITPRQIFLHQTVATLALVADSAPIMRGTQELVAGPVPLTPIQRWFFARNLPDPQHYNQAQLLTITPPFAPAVLAQAVQQLLRHHDALRLRFVRTSDGWQQINAGAERNTVFTLIDLAALPTAAHAPAITRTAAGVQVSLDLEHGPIMRAVVFACGADQPGRLLLVVHHLAVDLVSWAAILEDLRLAYEQLRLGTTVALPPKTTAFKQWAERLVTYAGSRALRDEAAYWLAAPRRAVERLPVDHAGANTVASARGMTIALSVEQTRALLHDVPPVYQTQINDVLLTALAQAFASWTGARTLLIELEGHGREDLFDDVDLTRTVGWFTTLFPLLLDVRQTAGPGSALKAIKEQLRAVPRRGLGYGVLRYGDDAAISAQLQALPPAEVSFNYLGPVDRAVSAPGLFGPAPEGSGPNYSTHGMRSHLLEVNGFIAEEQLRLEWTYSAAIHEPATIARLAEGYLAALRDLIAHCQNPDAGGFTPSDFPKAKLSQKELDTFLASVGRAKRRAK